DWTKRSALTGFLTLSPAMKRIVPLRVVFASLKLNDATGRSLAAQSGFNLAMAQMGSGFRHVLLGDIGATNARCADLSDDVFGVVKNFSVADFPRFKDVVRAFFDDDQ